jgi:uncharacterized protein (TIGR02246 family)
MRRRALRPLVMTAALGLMLAACGAGQRRGNVAEAGNSAEARGLAEARAAIEAGNRAWARSQVNGDAEGLAGLFTLEGRIITPQGVVQGREAILAFWRKALGAGRPSHAHVSTEDLGRDGDLAYEVGSYQYTYDAAAGAEPNVVAGRYVVVWKRQADGRWLIAIDCGVREAPR